MGVGNAWWVLAATLAALGMLTGTTIVIGCAIISAAAQVSVASLHFYDWFKNRKYDASSVRKGHDDD